MKLFLSCEGFGIVSPAFVASVSNILALLVREFTKWVFLANLIAWPLAYFIIDKWLQGFAYRSNLAVWIFGASAAFALFIAVMTVSFQSIKTALADPVNSLRYE